MNIVENIRIAIKSIAGNKMRSGLTALGIIIGVAAVITMVSIGEGSKAKITKEIQSLGSNLLSVRTGRGGPGVNSNLATSKVLNINDMEKIAKLPAVENISAELSTNATVKYGNESFQTSVIGTTPSYQDVRNSHVASGIFFSKQDVNTRRKVVVLGRSVSDDLFGTANPIGKTIKLKRQTFIVIGVMEKKESQGMENSDDRVFIPITTLQKRIMGTSAVQSISVQVKDEKYMDLTSSQIKQIMLKKFESEDDFDIGNQADLLSTFKNMTNTFTLLLGAIGGISLLVGGIGIMNIMLVSVTERTREIGIRKAIGAKSAEILMQFLIEAIVLSFAGGIIGILLGYCASLVISKLASMTTVVSLYSVLLSFGFSVAVGVFFGIYPASKASRLRPIEALRYE